MNLAETTKNVNDVLIGGISLLAFMIGGVFHLVSQFGFKWKPAYIIFLKSKSIVIEKTTKEADQIAICNAVRSLEQVAKTLVKNKYELKRIGERCK